MKRRTLTVPVAVLMLSSVTGAVGFGAGREGYYRFPAIHGETVVFSAEGDLWTVGIRGGIARRLTTHAGEESHPVISPDGRTLAFTATYEGPAELYTMPLDGGLPKRWTYEAEPSTAIGFTPSGRLVYSTTAYSTLPDPLLMTIDMQTGERSPVPLNQASDGTFDASGQTIYFARPQFHNNNTKRYKGGTARNIWKFSEDRAEAVNLTADFAGENHSPMWWDGRIYFVCDRDGTMNIWSMNEEGQDLKQLTRHSGWDVLSPALGQGRIVYQIGADLRIFDIERGRDLTLPITLASDFDQLREKWVDDPLDYVTAIDLHPEGESIVLTTRGRVFVVPASAGRTVRASKKEGVRYRDAVFMPDGQHVLALSDESGELEFHLLPANGVGSEEPLTSDGTILRFQGLASPDGRWIAFDDKNNDLWVLETATGQHRKVSQDREGIGEFSWSPDSRWLAYVMDAVNTYSQIHLYDLDTGASFELTGDRVNSFSPAWSRDGRFIYFVSERTLVSRVGSPWGSRQPEPFFDKTRKIYEVALRDGLRSPFRPKDELWQEEKKAATAGEVSVQIDTEGLRRRVTSLPIREGNIARGSLSANDQGLFWRETFTDPEVSSRLFGLKFSHEDPKPVELAEGVGFYDLSDDGKKLLIRQRQSLYVVDAAVRKLNNLSEGRVDLGNWNFPIDVSEDFRQLFIDAWRLERDYFWDPGMHGLDWEAMRDKYLPLVDRVTTRAELSDLIAQLVGELSALHVSVRGGDLRRGDNQIRLATLGARLVRAESAGGYRIDYIYRADPDYPEELSPLADPYLDLHEGDIITAINGTSTLSVTHPNQLLRNRQNRQVLLEIRPAGRSETRQVIVTPISRESNLRYSDWEYTRRLRVEKESDGQIGYVHLRAMGGGNLTEWYRNFYPVFNRKGLIIDVRHNRGGNIDSIILEKLLRRAWFYWKGRVGDPYWNMQYAFRGHMVVLCDELTASDGEAFTEGFRRLGLGKVIGTRTWGGEIWLSSNNRLSDGGLARAPQTGVYGPESEWLIEGHGVDPDIVVDNLPHATYGGKDAQLEAAIRYLQELIEKDPPDVPAPPAYPNKSFPYPKR